MKKITSLLFLFLSGAGIAQAPASCSARNDVAGNSGQAGLYGEYFSGYFNDSPGFFPSAISSANRIENNLNYSTNNWGAIVPPAANTVADPNTYSARYRGSIYIAAAGTYTFYLTSDDASFLWIDNDAISYPAVVANALINNGGQHGDVTVSASIALTAGLHNIQIQFGEQGGNNHLIFEYAGSSPAITRQVVPNSILCTGIQAAIAAPATAAPPGCSCSAGVTSEFYTGYFNDVQTFFTGNTPAISRTDARIGFTTDGSWGNVCPPLAGSNASPETFSARFTGQVYIPTTTTYTFYLTSDDAAYLWLDGNALANNPTTASATVNNSGLHSAATVSVSISLSAGLHNFKVHYGENTGNNVCYLEYASAGITRQIIPQTSYCSCMSNSTLPVELTSFSGTQESHTLTLLKWQTATELNNNRFELEKSTDGIIFVKAGVIKSKAPNGTSNIPLHYSFADTVPLTGATYYRLKQLDNDGKLKTLPIITVTPGSKANISLKVFPNPNNGQFTISVPGLRPDSYCTVRITGIDGTDVHSETMETTEDDEELKFNLHAEPGIYFLYVENKGTISTAKLVIQ